MTGKEKLEILLNGGVPETPPHWEMVFQIEEAMFGWEDRDTIADLAKRSALRLKVYERMIDEFGWAAVQGGYELAEIEMTKNALGHKALVPAFEGAGVFLVPDGDTMMDFTIKLFEQPEDLHAEAREKCNKAMAYFKQAVDAGADFFMLTYDFGYNDAPFVSPDHFSEFIAPYLTEIVECIHGLGKKAIMHSDGCIMPILDQIHATGVDGYQSVDPQGHMDIKEVRALYPDWILMGNVACNMLQDTDDEKIRESVKYCMTHGGIGKPYIFSTSNCVFKGMPPESYKIMVDEYNRMIAKC